MREQDEWDAHASFMDALVDEGFVVLGGPVADGDRVLMVWTRRNRAPWRLACAGSLAADGSARAAIEPWEILMDGRA